MIESLSGFIIHLIQSSGYFGVLLLMTLQSALIPIPSEVTMPFAGFLVGQGQFNFILVVLTGAVGNVIGGSIAYAIGYFLEENVILNLIKKYGKFLLVSEREYNHSTHWLQKYGSAIVFFGRMIPGVASFISLPAGIAEIKYWKFVLFTFLGSLIWSSILTSIGMYLGSKWDTLGAYFHKFDLIIIGIFVFAVLFYINHKLRIIKFGKK